jgi:hypothetical protein
MVLLFCGSLQKLGMMNETKLLSTLGKFVKVLSGCLAAFFAQENLFAFIVGALASTFSRAGGCLPPTWWDEILRRAKSTVSSLQKAFRMTLGSPPYIKQSRGSQISFVSSIFWSFGKILMVLSVWPLHAQSPRPMGTVVSWGEQVIPTLPAGTRIEKLAARGGHNLGLTSEGTVVAWGDNSSGQSTVPANLTGVIAIAAGGSHSLALKSDGRVIGWGRNDAGQSAVPANLSGAIAIAAGNHYSLALKSDGTVVAWGFNGFEQRHGAREPERRYRHRGGSLPQSGAEVRWNGCRLGG